jgi:hypothetical protein
MLRALSARSQSSKLRGNDRVLSRHDTSGDTYSSFLDLEVEIPRLSTSTFVEPSPTLVNFPTQTFDDQLTCFPPKCSNKPLPELPIRSEPRQWTLSTPPKAHCTKTEMQISNHQRSHSHSSTYNSPMLDWGGFDHDDSEEWAIATMKTVLNCGDTRSIGLRPPPLTSRDTHAITSSTIHFEQLDLPDVEEYSLGTATHTPDEYRGSTSDNKSAGLHTKDRTDVEAFLHLKHENKEIDHDERLNGVEPWVEQSVSSHSSSLIWKGPALRARSLSFDFSEEDQRIARDGEINRTWWRRFRVGWSGK